MQHPRFRPLFAVAAAAALTAITTAACSSGSSTAAPGSATKHAKTLNIVAGENFWGSIVTQLAGKAANVTSVVTDPNADPHDYQSSSDDARAFANADYVVLNGAGYDSWADKLLSGNPNGRRKVLTIADVLGKKEGDNPHFWYGPDYVTQVMDRVDTDLKAIDAGDAAYFDAQRRALDAAFGPYRSRLATIKGKFAGTPVASTESIFVYLAQYLGLNLISPPEFMQAVAEGNDPPAPSVAQFQSQINAKQAKVLVYNEQTSTAVTTNIKKLAAQAEIPTIGVTETIQPPDATFQQWFEGELEQLQNALNADALAGATTAPANAPPTSGP
ncbi:MAG: zinc ABC transporter substrate-binding protein [Acidimicrobiia bacterium]|nr:zinc ABC transporter substrate-binding protein [Acidimicrobiia bacterium]